MNKIVIRLCLTVILTTFMLGSYSPVSAQTISSSVPSKINSSDRFIFYLHGGVVTVKGDNAINDGAPEWGRYEYSNILDSLRKRGFNIISEIRKNGVDDSVYTNKIAWQIDSLLKLKVDIRNILLIGASAGWGIVLNVSARIKNNHARFVIMGGCWPDTHKDYEPLKLYGHFLSVYETSDPHQSCMEIFKNRKNLSSKMEIKLNTGLSHGFIYRGLKEWIDPIVNWYTQLR